MDASSGYIGWSMSRNAAAAYADGEMPKSKWTKAAMVEAIKGCCDDNDLAYADTFSQNDRYGLILHGGVGTGKSFMAAAIANRVIDHGFTALQTDIGSIATAMESSFEKRKATLKRILGYDLLVIDDIGAQRSTEYMMQHVYSVIDGRYRQGRPMVITTNLDFEGLSGGLASGPWGRIFDRISEVCYPVEFAGKSRRRVKSVEMRKAMRSRLGL